MTEYTLDDAISDAIERAGRDREGSFAVYCEPDGIVVRDAKAVAPPLTTQPHCIAQFWAENGTGDAMVQVRFDNGLSEWRTPFGRFA